MSKFSFLISCQLCVSVCLGASRLHCGKGSNFFRLVKFLNFPVVKFLNFPVVKFLNFRAFWKLEFLEVGVFGSRLVGLLSDVWWN